MKKTSPNIFLRLFQLGSEAGHTPIIAQKMGDGISTILAINMCGNNVLMHDSIATPCQIYCKCMHRLLPVAGETCSPPAPDMTLVTSQPPVDIVPCQHGLNSHIVSDQISPSSNYQTSQSGSMSSPVCWSPAVDPPMTDHPCQAEWLSFLKDEQQPQTAASPTYYPGTPFYYVSSSSSSDGSPDYRRSCRFTSRSNDMI